MIQMMIFDMAGTTVNEANVVYRTLHQVLAQAGHDLDLPEVMRKGAGKAKLQAIRELMTPVAGASPYVLHETFLDQLHRAYRDLRVSPFPGVEPTFHALRQAGVKVVLNTGYDRSTAEQLLTKLNWQVGPNIDALITASDVERGRPAPDMILQVMKHFAIEDARQVGKIGDSMVDIEEGQAAGCGWTVGITTGAQSREQLLSAQPTAVIDQMQELPPLVGIPLD